MIRRRIPTIFLILFVLFACERADIPALTVQYEIPQITLSGLVRGGIDGNDSIAKSFAIEVGKGGYVAEVVNTTEDERRTWGIKITDTDQKVFDYLTIKLGNHNKPEENILLDFQETMEMTQFGMQQFEVFNTPQGQQTRYYEPLEMRNANIIWLDSTQHFFQTQSSSKNQNNFVELSDPKFFTENELEFARVQFQFSGVMRNVVNEPGIQLFVDSLEGHLIFGGVEE